VGGKDTIRLFKWFEDLRDFMQQPAGHELPEGSFKQEKETGRGKYQACP
jgi:hypothetical protein